MEQYFAEEALMSMTSHLIFIIITWRALQSVNFDAFFRKNRVFEARALLIIITIALGTTVSNFFLDFLSWSNSLVYLF
ncbi:DUF1146 domain-containing protein [Halobacillus kuroshimensis]|uniref:DUF1146 domain-containing protein n=2 Tax=Halobacillus TaxID=45667 RepID=A0A845DRI9_9BACI|nr:MULTISPECIES: DUF1146 family protein [Halobacillus]MBN8235010.1 DUF1146 domain-containing protein [Halobacillus kuroshimensis]MCA1020928.1 DUF1146 family protein [Halobacillus litoralis]MYL20241.1 DUF1146 domain-containing protein [Halobacillus litoralis]MYL29335.1 DUF1146 domain-containing protein [Halobacillus halophilus]MYL36552.1 DUF1146 domain-containing protein [Halobacillus litoralis]